MNLSALRKALDTWRQGGLLEADAAGRILAFEEERRRDDSGTSLAQILALGLGGLLLTAGVLLFIAANWDELSPASRFALVLAMVFAAHAVAVWRRSPPALPVILHAVGTGFCGAGIFLAGQVFHLQAHWPAAFMLWAAGAAAGWWLLRQWPQGAWLAILAPIWIAGEYTERLGDPYNLHSPLWSGLLVLAVSYLTLDGLRDPILRRVLRWIGLLCAIPFATASVNSFLGFSGSTKLSVGGTVLTWMTCLAVPIAVDALIRRRLEWRLAVAGVGAFLLSTTGGAAGGSLSSEFWHRFGGYLVGAVMALAMTWWGIASKRPERINLGVLGFGFVVFVYYFSNVMDKFGRSLSLLGLGALFFILAFALGKVRTRLLAEMHDSAGETP